jgi:hypothetical protein
VESRRIVNDYQVQSSSITIGLAADPNAAVEEVEAAGAGEAAEVGEAGASSSIIMGLDLVPDIAFVIWCEK